MNYIELPLKEALAAKFADGRAAHGNSDIFDGHALEELFGEMLDGMNYCDEAQKQFGLDYSHIRRRLLAIALETQTDYRCLQNSTQ